MGLTAISFCWITNTYFLLGICAYVLITSGNQITMLSVISDYVRWLLVLVGATRSPH